MALARCLSPARSPWVFLLLMFLVPWSSSLVAKERRKVPVEFVVITPSYNNAKWCKKNLESVFCQTYPHWFLHYVNDNSTDNTGEEVEKYVKERNMQHKCRIVHNKTNRGAAANWYYSVNAYPSDKVIVCLDGDDWLKDPTVLAKLAKIYENPKVWMTFGSYISYPQGTLGMRNGSLPSKVIKQRLFRKYRWVTSHLRTFYAGLFQKIKKDDFMYKGKFMPTTCDLAMMFPMLEMASKGHIRHIKDVLYVYNMSNPIMDCKTRRKMQADVEHYIRSQKRYEPLSTSAFKGVLTGSRKKVGRHVYNVGIVKSISPVNVGKAA